MVCLLSGLVRGTRSAQGGNFACGKALHENAQLCRNIFVASTVYMIYMIETFGNVIVTS